MEEINQSSGAAVETTPRVTRDQDPVEILWGMAQKGEIDPWYVNIIDTTDRFLSVLDRLDSGEGGAALIAQVCDRRNIAVFESQDVDNVRVSGKKHSDRQSIRKSALSEVSIRNDIGHGDA